MIIMKMTQMRTNHSYLYSEFAEQGSWSLSLRFGRNSKAGRQVEKYDSEEREGFDCSLIGSCWHKEGGGGITRSRISYVISLGSKFGFLCLVLS